MKRIISTLLLTFILAGLGWSQSTVPLYDNFDADAPRDSLHNLRGWRASPCRDAGERFQITAAGYISGIDPLYSEGTVTAYIDTVLTNADGAHFAMVIAGKETFASTKFMTGFIMSSDTCYGTPGTGYYARFWYDPAGTDKMYIGRKTGGSSGYVPFDSVSLEFQVGDTIGFDWYAGGSKKVAYRKNTTSYDTLVTTDQTYDKTTFKMMLRDMEKEGAGTLLDYAMLGPGTTVLPPDIDTVAPNIESAYIYPGSWNSTTTGYISVRVTDFFGLDSVYIMFGPTGAMGDSLVVQCGTTVDTTVVWNISAKAVGSYTWQIRVTDDSSNVTTGALQYLTVSDEVSVAGVKVVLSAVMGVIARYPGQPQVAGYWGNNTISFPSEWDYSTMDYIIYFPNMNGYISTTAGEEWMPEAVTNGAAPYGYPAGGSLGAQKDYELEWNTIAWGLGSEQYNVRKIIYDSCQANGVRLLLDVEDLFTSPNIMEVIVADSVKSQSFADSLYAYSIRRGYTGWVIDWEWPETGFTADDFSRFGRILRRKLDLMSPTGILGQWVAPWYPYGNYDKMIAGFNESFDWVAPMIYAYGRDNAIGHWTQLNQEAANRGKGYWDPSLSGYPDHPNHGIKSWMGGSRVTDSSKVAMVFTGEQRRIVDDGSLAPIYIGKPLASPLTVTQWGDAGRYRKTTYRHAMEALTAEPGGYIWSNDSKSPYHLNAAANIMYIYDNPQSIREKTNWALSQWPLEWIVVWDAINWLYPSPTAGHTFDEAWQALGEYSAGGASSDTLLSAPTLVYPADSTLLIARDTSLVWNSKAGASAYTLTLRYRLNGAGSKLPLLITTTTDTTYDLSSLTLSRLNHYFWSVAAINSAGTGTYAAERMFTVIDLVLSAPEAVTLVSPAANATDVVSPVIFQWTRPNYTDWFDFQLGYGSDTNALVAVLNSVKHPDTTFTYTGTLNWSAAYHWRVRAGNPTGNGPWTAYRKFTTADTALSLPPGQATQFLAKWPDGTKGYREIDGLAMKTKTPSNVLTPPSGRVEIFFNSLDGKVYSMDQDRTMRELGGGGALSIPPDLSVTSLSATNYVSALSVTGTTVAGTTVSATNLTANNLVLTRPLSWREGGLGIDSAQAAASGIGYGAFNLHAGAIEIIPHGANGYVWTSTGASGRPSWQPAAAGFNGDILDDTLKVIRTTVADTLFLMVDSVTVSSGIPWLKSGATNGLGVGVSDANGGNYTRWRYDTWDVAGIYNVVNHARASFRIHHAGSATPSDSVLVVEQSAGTDVFTVGNQGNVEYNGQLTQNAMETKTLTGTVTTIAVTKNFVLLDGDTDADDIATITGAKGVGLYTFLFTSGSVVTVSNDDGHSANTIDLVGAADFTGADDSVLQLFFDGTSWYEVSRSVN